MTTLAAFATQYGQLPTIQRAISYAPAIESRLLSIPVEWSFSLRSSAGYFHSRPMLITLHPDLTRQGRAALIDTFLHETAHAIQWLRHAEVSHGESWWEAMHQLGAKPQRTHKMHLQQAGLRSAASAQELDL